MTIGLALSVALAAPAPSWDFIGTSTSGLRMFVDRGSIRQVGGLAEADVRLGSPRTIAGRIVEVIEREEIDCARPRWRMLRYEAFDETGAIVGRGSPAGDLLPVAQGSIGEAIRDAVCAGLAPASPRRPGG